MTSKSKVAGTLEKSASKSLQNPNVLPVKNRKQVGGSAVLLDQENKLYNWLKTEPGINTLDARKLGINHPAGRIKGLRHRGHNISTHWTEAISQNGRVTRVAFYILDRNPQRSIFDLPGVSVTRHKSEKVA